MKTALFLVFWLMTSLASAADHYILLFSHDSIPPKPGKSHNFATFIEVEGRDIRQHFAINWGPVKDYQLFDGKVEGRNATMIEGLDYASQSDEPKKISMFGPYRITSSTFQSAEVQRRRLESGEFLYQVVDRVVRTETSQGKPGVNCIHAILDVVADTPSGGKYGEKASEMIAKYFKSKGAIVDRSEFYNWIPDELGLGKYKIDWKE